MASPTSKPIALKNVRLSFPRLWEPKSFEEGQKPRYEATFLLDPSDKAHLELIDKRLPAVFRELAEEAYTSKKDVENFMKVFKSSQGYADEEGKVYDGYEGMYFIASHNTQPPAIIDRDKSPLGAESGKPYAGCYVNASISFWLQDNKYGKRINTNLRGVQFLRDGEAFGAGIPDVDGEFDDESDDDDDIF